MCQTSTVVSSFKTASLLSSTSLKFFQRNPTFFHHYFLHIEKFAVSNQQTTFFTFNKVWASYDEFFAIKLPVTLFPSPALQLHISLHPPHLPQAHNVFFPRFFPLSSLLSFLSHFLLQGTYKKLRLLSYYNCIFFLFEWFVLYLI